MRVVEHVVELLPEEFHGVSVFWAFTSGHGIKPGIRIRLCLLARPAARRLGAEDLARAAIAEKLIDPALYNPAQAIYTAAPVFVGMPDPVPYRCGIWRGYSDAVTPRSSRSRSAGPQQRRQGRASGQGGGYAAHRARIGDGDGSGGFHEPLKTAVAAFIGEAGAAPTRHGCAPIWNRRSAMRRAIRRCMTDAYIEFRVADLDTLIAMDPRPARARSTGRALSRSSRPIPAPLGESTSARRKVDAAMKRFADVALAWPTPARRTTTGLTIRSWPMAEPIRDEKPAPGACGQCRSRHRQDPGMFVSRVIKAARRGRLSARCLRCRGTSSATKSSRPARRARHHGARLSRPRG